MIRRIMHPDMSTNENPRARFLEELIRRADADPPFRRLLLSHPRAALQEAFGIEVPDQVTLQVVEESADHVYIVLPARSGEGGAPEEDRQKWIFATWACVITIP